MRGQWLTVDDAGSVGPHAAVGMVLLVASCVGLPPSPPSDDGPVPTATGTDVGTTIDPGSNAPESGEPASSTGPGSADDTTTGGPSTASVGGIAMLAIAEAPTHDFGPIPIRGQSTYALTVTNEGDAEATGLGPAVIAAPFALNGPFPGNAGTCGPSLAVGQACLVEVAFTPTELGPSMGTLTIGHDDGGASCDLLGAGTGQSGNLLVNPGGESVGSPPPGWTAAGAGTWVAGSLAAPFPSPIQGAAYLMATTGPSNVDFVLRQDVSVSAWASAIDTAALRLAFEGQARSYQLDNDELRIRVEYRDAGNTVLELWDTNWVTTAAWQAWSDDRLAPVGTRTIRVELMCRKSAAEYCDAYFDALDLHAAYP